MDKNIKCNSYSDLFEDFFRSDAVQDQDNVIGSNQTVGVVNDDLFKGYLNDVGDEMSLLQNNFEQIQSYYLPQQEQQQQAQQIPFYQQAQMPAYSYQPSAMTAPTLASVQKPGFIRNRTRKNMRQKSVAAAVKASHMMAAASGQAGSGYPLIQMYQPTIPTVISNQIPYYQAAAQIPAYQPPPQQPQMILAKSPVAQPANVLLPSGQRSQPYSPARSPNINSSDYVKFKLQQKIRSRMVSKGQIPPNPTEEELRMCGMPVPIQNHQSQIPTPKQSPQIPRAFSNNAAAFISAPVMINNQLQGQQQNDDLMKYLDLSGFSQKDPLMLPETNTTKQQQQQQKQQQQPDFTFPQQEVIQNNNGTISYDQFFSDFILY